MTFGVVAFVVLLLFAIALHEFGHFFFAKLFGMKVDRFFIGFGPPLWSVKRGETEYGIAVLPFGGYVRIAGMNPFEEVPEEDQARTFKARPAWQRAIVLVAGSATHFIIAFFISGALLMFVGVPDHATTTIETVEPKLENGEPSPAAISGLRAGDRVVAIEGMPITRWEEARAWLRASPLRPLEMTVLRGGKRVDLTVTPAFQDSKSAIGFIGVKSVFANKRFGLVDSVVESGKGIGDASWQSLRALGKIVSPSTFVRLFKVATGREERSFEDPTTIVGISRAAGDAAARGNFEDLLYMFVGFNIFVGVANLLPLPPLDGGHIAVLAYEQVRRRPVDMRKLLPISAVVVSLLIGLFVILLYLDIVKPLPSLPG